MIDANEMKRRLNILFNSGALEGLHKSEMICLAKEFVGMLERTSLTCFLIKKFNLKIRK